LGFQKQAKDEVVITDAKLEIVFASHNMTKMNGYVEEEDRKKPKNVSRSFSVLTSRNKGNSAQQPFEQTVVNYNKNGEIYICLIKGFLYLILKVSCPILLLLKRHKKIPLVEKGTL
jgi:hypothetical protein